MAEVEGQKRNFVKTMFKVEKNLAIFLSFSKATLLKLVGN